MKQFFTIKTFSDLESIFPAKVEKLFQQFLQDPKDPSAFIKEL